MILFLLQANSLNLDELISGLEQIQRSDQYFRLNDFNEYFLKSRSLLRAQSKYPGKSALYEKRLCERLIPLYQEKIKIILKKDRKEYYLKMKECLKTIIDYHEWIQEYYEDYLEEIKLKEKTIIQQIREWFKR